MSTRAPKEPTVSGGRRRRIAVVPFGCKVSRIEAESLFETGPGSETAEPDTAEVVVLYGCAVTSRAERDQRRCLRRIRRDSAGATVVVSGCLARLEEERLARLPEVDLVVPPSRLGDLSSLLDEREAGLLPGKLAPPHPGGPPEVFAATLPGEERTRAFLKIQDGCERRCAFCVVPSIRGAERSAPLEVVESEIRRLGDMGVPEVVLAGVHLAAWGKERGTSLLALLRALEKNRPACRVRLSSLEPMEAGEALVESVAASPAVVPHLHLPLQSGSDAVLRRMRRGITAARFRALARRALGANSRLHLATDLIAGFPGETDAEFEATERLVQELPFASLHVFPFSPRSGTRGAELFAERAVPSAIVTRRAASLRILGEEKARLFRRRASGTVSDAVVLRGRVALTDHYLEAALRAPLPPGTRVAVLLEASGPDAVLTAVPAAEAATIPPPEPTPAALPGRSEPR
ncbi:MAG: MiaB/RimO family radical SAM methylthiotransferase [Acidithiobacillales bacterium]